MNLEKEIKSHLETLTVEQLKEKLYNAWLTIAFNTLTIENATVQGIEDQVFSDLEEATEYLEIK